MEKANGNAVCIAGVGRRHRLLRGPKKQRAHLTLVDDGDFLDRKLRGDLRAFLGDHHHFFEPYSPLQPLAVLCFHGKTHLRLDVHGEIERIDARNNRSVVLSQTEPVAS